VIFYLLKNNDDFHHILEAKISPPIFVDSRKTARENHKNLKVFKFSRLKFYYFLFNLKNFRLEKYILSLNLSIQRNSRRSSSNEKTRRISALKRRLKTAYMA